MKNDIIYLVSIEKEQDEDGFLSETISEFRCFGEVRDVKYTEYYQASLAGITASAVVSVNDADYHIPKIRPSRVRIDDTMYKIIRRYRKKKENSVELTLEEIENVDGS